MVRAEEAEEQQGNFLKALRLPPTWQEETLALVEEQTSGEKERTERRPEHRLRVGLNG
jgi:hypothetical protein